MNAVRFLSLAIAFGLGWQTTLSAQKRCRVEYFLDNDPGHGAATAVTDVQAGSNTLIFDLSAATIGAHVLYVRAQDADGHWSATVSRPLYVMSPAADRITAVEYYFDAADPGFGKATAVSVPADSSKPFTFDIDIEDLALGDHQLNVRARDNGGRWSLVSSCPFTLSEASAIAWTMPLQMRAEGTSVMLEGGGRSADVLVEVFFLSGMRLHAAHWKASQRSLTLPVPEGAAVVVKATDMLTRRYVVRTLSAKR